MKTLSFSVVVLLLLLSCNDNEGQQNFKTISDNAAVVEEHDSQHYLHEKTFGHLNYTTEKQWDSLNGIKHLDLPQNKIKVKVKEAYRTFGWHVYSNGTSYKNYNFSLLWGISYFSYIVNPETGGYKNIHQWKTTQLIDSAKANNCKVFLTVSNFGKKDNALFLKNQRAQETMVDSIISLLSFRDANGINIDFENVAAVNKTEYTNFIGMLSKKLKQANPNYMVSLCLYAVDYNDIFNIKAIDPYIDFYTLMGYDYYGSFSSYAGPVTPLKKSKAFGAYCLEASVSNYIDKGVAAEKLIVGLPYYGAEWHIKNPTIPSKSENFVSHPPYRRIKEFYMDSLKIPVLFDTESASTYLDIKNSDGTIKQLWFEDRRSLAIKYDWIKSKNIGGVGIWALGYDHGTTELWDLLSDKFGQEK